MAFFRLILEERSEEPPWIRSFHHFFILRMTKIALFLAVVPISGYFSSSGSSSFFFSAFLFCSIYTMIFVRSGSSDSSNSDNLRASLASASSSSSSAAAGLSPSDFSAGLSLSGSGSGSVGCLAITTAAAAAADAAATAAAVTAEAAAAGAGAAAVSSPLASLITFSISCIDIPPCWTVPLLLLLSRMSWFVLTVSNNISNIIDNGVSTVGRSFCNSSSSSFDNVLPLLWRRVCFSIK